MQQGVCA